MKSESLDFSLKVFVSTILTLTLLIFICMICFVFFSSCSFYPDNFVEEELESYIETNSGIRIDFTGSSPED